MSIFWKSQNFKWALALVAASTISTIAVAVQPQSASDTNIQDRVSAKLMRMMGKSVRPVTDDAARKEREGNYVFVTNLLQTCGIPSKFTRLEDDTPILSDWIGGCDGAYKEIPCFVAIDDKYAHGSAIFPEAGIDNTNMIEFVTLANRIVKTGSFEYDSTFGLVIYSLSMPMDAVRKQGKTTLGMIYGFPVMEVDLFSEAYRCVLYGEKIPKEAMRLVGKKVEKIEEREPESGSARPSEAAVSAIQRYFKDKGFPYHPEKLDYGLLLRGTLTSCRKSGMKNDGYDFHLIIDDEWVRSRVWLPNTASNQHAKVRAFITRKNRDLKSHTLVFNEKDGSVVCRTQIHVVEFAKDVPDAMIDLLRTPVEILDECSSNL